MLTESRTATAICQSNIIKYFVYDSNINAIKPKISIVLCYLHSIRKVYSI